MIGQMTRLIYPVGGGTIIFKCIGIAVVSGNGLTYKCKDSKMNAKDTQNDVAFF